MVELTPGEGHPWTGSLFDSLIVNIFIYFYFTSLISIHLLFFLYFVHVINACIKNEEMNVDFHLLNTSDRYSIIKRKVSDASLNRTHNKHS